MVYAAEPIGPKVRGPLFIIIMYSVLLMRWIVKLCTWPFWPGRGGALCGGWTRGLQTFDPSLFTTF